MLFELVTVACGLGVFTWITFSIQSSTKLVLDHYENPPESIQNVFTGYNNSLRTIQLKGFQFDFDLIEQFSSLLTRNPNINELTFDAGNLNIQFIKKIPFTTLNQLKVLKIVNAQLTFDKFDPSFLNQLPASLVHLEIVLFGNHLSDIHRIKFPLGKFVNLKIFRFVGFNDSIVDWKSSLQSIPFPNLIETLDLTNCSLKNIESFFTKSGKYRLKELHLGKNNIQVGESSFKNCLEKCPNLELLDLSNNELVELDVFESIFVKGSFPKMKSLLLTQENSVYFSSSNPFQWLDNLKNLKCFHMESRAGTELLLSVEGFEFEELFLSPDFTVSSIDFSKMKKLSLSSDSLAEIEVNEFLTVQELKVYFYPNELNYKVVFDYLSKFKNLISLGFVWMKDCEEELRVRIFDSFLCAVDQMNLLKSLSLKNKEKVSNCFPAMIFANRAQFDSLELDISSIQNLSEWEFQITKICNLSSLSLNMTFLETFGEEKYNLFENIEQLENLKTFKFTSILKNPVRISNAFDKMPNLINLEVGEIHSRNADNFFPPLIPINVRVLTIHNSNAPYYFEYSNLYQMIPYFPNLGNVYFSNYIDHAFNIIVTCTFTMAQFIPFILSDSSITISDVELRSLFVIMIHIFSIPNNFSEGVLLRNKKLAPLFNATINPWLWKNLERSNFFGFQKIFQIINLFSEGYNFDLFFKFVQIHDTFFADSPESLSESTYRQMLELIFFKKCIQENAFKRLKTIDNTKYPISFLVKNAKDLFTNNPDAIKISFEGILETVLIKHVLINFNEDAEVFIPWIQQNDTILEFAAWYIRENDLKMSDIDCFFQFLNAETRHEQFYNFIANYEPTLKPICSQFNVFSRYFGLTSNQFVEAIISDSMTEKDQEFLELVFENNEKVMDFVGKLKEFYQKWNDSNKDSDIPPILIFSTSNLSSFYEMTNTYHDFLKMPIEINTCPICLLNDHLLSLNFEQFNGRIIACAHKIHDKCMKKWLLRQQKYECPYCTVPFKFENENLQPPHQGFDEVDAVLPRAEE